MSKPFILTLTLQLPSAECGRGGKRKSTTPGPLLRKEGLGVRENLTDSKIPLLPPLYQAASSFQYENHTTVALPGNKGLLAKNTS